MERGILVLIFAEAEREKSRQRDTAPNRCGRVPLPAFFPETCCRGRKDYFQPSGKYFMVLLIMSSARDLISASVARPFTRGSAANAS